MKITLLLVSCFLLIGLMGIASACVVPPRFEAKTCNFSYEAHNESEIIDLLNNKTAECSFNSEDIAILKDFLANGYTIREQTDEEYVSFLEQAIKDNGKKGCAFAKYTAVFHRGKWTGIVKGNAVDESGGGCPAPTCGVMAAIMPNILWNDLGSGKDCKNLYWIDNANKECGQKQFCGMYMYQGLETFESKVQCEKALNPEENKTFHLSNGRNAEIKIMPEAASQKAIERLGELNFTVQLKEVGNDKVAYELTGNKQGKFLGIFKIMAKVQAQVDAETGNVKVIKPWWSFLASGI